jgi:hypothetical protein
VHRSRGISVSIAPRLWAARSANQGSILGWGDNFSRLHRVHWNLRPNHSLTQWVLRSVSPQAKRPRREVDHSPQSTGEVQNTWSYLHSPVRFDDVKQRDNFAFTYILNNVLLCRHTIIVLIIEVISSGTSFIRLFMHIIISVTLLPLFIFPSEGTHKPIQKHGHWYNMSFKTTKWTSVCIHSYCDVTLLEVWVWPCYFGRSYKNGFPRALGYSVNLDGTLVGFVRVAACRSIRPLRTYTSQPRRLWDVMFLQHGLPSVSQPCNAQHVRCLLN